MHDKLATVAITEVEREDPSEDGEFVYDLEVEDTHCFVTSGGVTVHNCFGTPTVGGEITLRRWLRRQPHRHTRHVRRASRPWLG